MAQRRLEESHQAAYFEWINLKSIEYNGVRIPLAELVHHIPNERTEAGQRRKLKRLGVLSGVWDIFVPVPIIDDKGEYYAGLYIEMKAGKNTLTTNQAKFGRRVYAVGYATSVCYTVGEAIAATERYLGDLIHAHKRADVQATGNRQRRDIFH